MLKVDHLTLETKREKTILNDINFELKRGEILGLTGKSGAGKSSLIKGIIGIQDKNIIIKEGGIYLEGVDLNGLSQKTRRGLCGTTLGLIPQNPMAAFDIRKTIGKQFLETLRLRLGLSKYDALKYCQSSLINTNLSDVDRILESYPSELSGGMLQRIVVALTTSLKPKFILADEPTSALDEENQLVIMNLLEQQKDSGILLISHNVACLKRLTSKTMVLEDGCLIEVKKTNALIENPGSKWTQEFAHAYGLYQQHHKEDFVWTK